MGTARTALFNYLFAKRHDGAFILRIEDTDLERSQAVYEQNIYDSLHALGLSWDEGPDVGGPYAPYKQSESLALYQEWAQKLEAQGAAYRCYCTPEEIDAERQQAQEEKRPYVYSLRCYNPATREELAKDPSRKPTLRFHVPESRGQIVIQDHVRGDVTFDSALIGDFVIMKSDGTPTYNFAVVVDDARMKISHVIRGEDHISNTPKQILIYEALGLHVPEFAHVGMILAPDKSKLSKRHGATAVSDFIKQGYLPEAFCNFLSLLGWSPPDGEEIGTLSHFASQFSLDRITQSPAIFDKDKLNFLNGKMIRTMDLKDLLERAKPYLEAYDLSQYSEEKLLLMLDAVREPITVLSELPDAVIYFFGRQVILDARLIGEVLTGDEPHQVLARFQSEFLATTDFDNREQVAAHLKAFTQAMKPMKTKTVMWTLRAALTGRVHGADLSTTLYLLGKDVVAQRVETALTLTAAV